MKKVLLFSILALTVSGMVKGQNYQSTTDVIYGQRCFVEVNGVHYDTGDQNGSGSFSWPSRSDAQVCYYLHLPDGYISMSAFFNTKASAAVKLRITDPDTYATLLENELTTGSSGSNIELQLVKDLRIPTDKWYRFEFSTNKSSNISSINKLEFKRESSNQIVTSNRFMAASTHLWNRKPTDPMAPSGESYDWSYQEVMYPSKYLRVATYVESMGVMGGYMGIQYDGNFNGDKNYKVIFSMWDNGDVDSDPNLPDYMRSGNLDHDPNITIARFGGEKTGIQAMYHTGQWWKPDQWVQFLFNTRPEQVTVTAKGQDGKDSTFIYENSIVTAWYKMASDPDWTYLATHRASGKSYLFSTFYSFLENYGDCGEIYTRAYWRKGYLRSAASGKWYGISSYTFTNNDGGSARTSRHDFGRGATDALTNAFYMEHGGYTSTVNDSSHYVGVPLDQSCVDTIDIDAKVERVNQAIRKDAAKQAEARLKSTGETYDLSKWELLGFSDQEEEGDGDYGRAAQALDGNPKSYWRNKWRNGGVLYPHWIALKAPSKATISEVGVYTDKRSYLYWPAKVIVFTSEDGNTWTQATDTLEIPRSATATAQLPHRLTSQYFKLEFTEGYGAMMIINELSLATDVSSTRIYEYAAQLLDNAGCFDSYPAKALTALRRAYNNGQGNIDEIAAAISDLNATSSPLKYGHATSAYSIISTHRYQLSSHNGYGKLIGNSSGNLSVGQAKLSGALDEYKRNVDVTNLKNNWMVIKAEGYNKYYLYNPGLRRYIDADAPNCLSETPAEVSIDYMYRDKSFLITSRGKLITLDPTSQDQPVKALNTGNMGSYFDFYDNYYLTPSDAEAKYIINKCVDYAKFDTYVAKLSRLLNVPEGLVGSVPAGEERDYLTQLYNNGNITIDRRSELYRAVDSCHCLPFEPTKYVYRIKSMASNQSSTPILTANDQPSTEYKALAANNVAQIWAFPANGEALSPTSQDVSLGRLAEDAGTTVKHTRSRTKQAGRYYVTEDQPGVFSISTTQYGGMAYSALYNNTTAYYGNSNSQFRLQIVDNIEVNLNSAGMRAINYAFDILVPEDLKVYVVDHIDGTAACFLRVYDRLPAGTPAVICGEANDKVTLQIAAPTGKPLGDNMLKGTYFAKSGIKGNIFVLNTLGGGRFTKATTGNVPENSAYLQLGDDVTIGILTLNFSDEPTGIKDCPASGSEGKSDIYDLYGRKLSNPQGIYIQGGKAFKH